MATEYIFSPEDVVDKTFDYIICGGGTAGLTLAARLSEDPNITVAVLEAGEHNIGEPLIDIPGQFGATFGNPKFDWAFPVVPQKYSQNKTYFWQRGKALGGSSTINFNAWTKPPAKDIDAIEELGNPGWGWAEYSKYTRLSETYVVSFVSIHSTPRHLFHPAAKEQADAHPQTPNLAFRGKDGPVQIAVPFSVTSICTDPWNLLAVDTVGSTSMLPLDKQGVVSPELKVYGTANLRVVDVGIVPIQIASHVLATTYVTAEKAADMITGKTRKI
ncbi:GMC oxidoreductase [Mycena kentingensis (nom. inval.)]|nr:GMC oxidoreductase [Mycena kentingensis (nom. inval.)]